MHDEILLEDLRVECIIGDLPHERQFPQELFLSLKLICDLSLAGSTDRLADTVNYVAVLEAVRAALHTAKCQMLERAAHVVAETAFALDVRIEAVDVTLRKPHALPGVIAGVHIRRSRKA